VNILLVSGMFPPMRTGTAFYARNLALALAARGHAVTVVALGAGEGTEELPAVCLHRLPALRLPLARFFKHFQVSAVLPRNWSALHRLVRESGADVVLLVNHYLDIAFPALAAARRAGVPAVCSVGTQLQSMNPRRDRVLNALDRLICGRLVFPLCERVIAWDTQILQYLADVHGRAVTDKCVIVNYGVNGDPGQLLAHRHDYRLRERVIGVGAVSEQRSFVPLVRAVALLAREFPGVRLRVIGHVYHDEAVRLARDLGIGDRVEFDGERSHDEVLAAMGESDLLYSSLTAKYVGLGTATIEAMLMGVPTVANVPLDLLGEARLEDRTHLVACPDTDPEAIAGRIRMVLADQALRERVGQGGRRFILEHMSWDKVAADMEAALAPLVHRPDG
jgi:glycosyltransferase involved in cell wall biosynthesis